MQDIELLLFFALLVFFSYFYFSKKALDFNGVLAANIVAILVFFGPRGGWVHFFTLLIFFIAGDYFTRKSIGRKNFLKKHESRSVGNIFGNVSIAVAGLWLGMELVFFAAISTALADTLSSEIGLLSRKKPKMVVPPFNEVEAGTNGAVSLLGLTASLFGAIIIGFVYLAANFASLNYAIFLNTALIVCAGVFGALADSFLGATLESKKLISNDFVNFFSTLAGAVFAMVLQAVLL